MTLVQSIEGEHFAIEIELEHRNLIGFTSVLVGLFTEADVISFGLRETPIEAHDGEIRGVSQGQELVSNRIVAVFLVPNGEPHRFIGVVLAVGVLNSEFKAKLVFTSNTVSRVNEIAKIVFFIVNIICGLLFHEFDKNMKIIELKK